MKKTLLLFVLMLALSVSGFSQTATTKTTTTAAVTYGGGQIAVLSTTGITTPTTTAPQFGYLDQELVQILSISGTTLTVLRGQGGSFQSAHQSGTVFWAGPPSSNNAGVFVSTTPVGSCTRGAWTFLPLINQKTGDIVDCILSTTGTTSTWSVLNLSQYTIARPYKKLSTAVAAYTALPTDEIIGVNTNQATTITIPALTGFAGKKFTIQQEVSAAVSVTIATSSGQKINGATSITFPNQNGATFGGVTIYSNGQDWFVSKGY